MTQGKNPGCARNIACEIIAALMKGRRTIRELAEMVKANDRTIEAWVKALRMAGLVRVAEFRKMAGPAIRVYEWQRYPFEFEDVTP